MAKKQKKNCYAVHWIDEKKDFIVKSWDECQKLTKGHNNMFKGFMSDDEAKEWLKGITKQKEEKHSEQVKKNREIKKIKKDRIQYMFRIDKNLSDDLQKELNNLHISVDRLMDDLIRDYLYGEE